MVRLLYFAAARDAAGGARTEQLDASTVGEALKLAAEMHGELFERVLRSCTILHRDEKVDPAGWFARALGADDEIAVLPPVSGGEDEHEDERFNMVDVGDKEETKREAVAVCRVRTTPATRDRLLAGAVGKGDAPAAAQIAATLAAKRTPELIPMCHPVRTTFVGVELNPAGDDAIEVRATVRGRDRTGFEMEALTACSVAALTLYDFAKAEDPRMRIEGLRIVSKSGGKSRTVTYE